MALLDVNALVALAWDSHIHHSIIRGWFDSRACEGWATCPVSESGFVRVSSNPAILPGAIAVGAAIGVLKALRGLGGHTFLSDDVSIAGEDFPEIHGHRQVTDAHLLMVARRHGVDLLTFDKGLAKLAEGRNVLLLESL